MKIRYYTYIWILCSLLCFAGCENESIIPDTGEEKVPITLSASSLPVSVDVQTRAETINKRSIGIVAAKATGSSISDVTSWTDYYLDHVRANGTDTNLNGEKQVTFATFQWWPFNPAEFLAFVAYSPYSGTGGDSRVARVVGTNTLKVTAGTTNAFPDFLYTTPMGSYNKVVAQNAQDNAISLGEFQHAMAKLDIRIILVDKNGDKLAADKYPDPNRIRITELKVSTEVNSGEFDLLQTAEPKAWTSLNVLATKQMVRTHISTATELAPTLSTYTNCFLLPGTENESYVSVTIQEWDETTNAPLNTIIKEAKIEEFEVSAGVGAKLEMGKTTLLTIKVKYMPIPDPENIILEGQLVEWNYKGKSTVTIE